MPFDPIYWNRTCRLTIPAAFLPGRFFSLHHLFVTVFLGNCGSLLGRSLLGRNLLGRNLLGRNLLGSSLLGIDRDDRDVDSRYPGVSSWTT